MKTKIKLGGCFEVALVGALRCACQLQWETSKLWLKWLNPGPTKSGSRSDSKV
jgi:hypothetical protein